MLRSVAELKKRQLPFGVALFLCLFVGACSRTETPQAGEQLASASDSTACRADVTQLKELRVERVVDGDTLRLSDGDSLRLVGINTPEIGRDGRADEPLAREAARALAELLEPGRRVLLAEAEDGRDRHGRLLAYAFDAQGRNLSALLIGKGLGFHVAIAPNVRFADCSRTEETAARNARLGVWAQPQFAPKSIAQLRPDQGGFVLLRDRVTRVSFKDNGWWLQLGGKVGVKIGETLQPAFSQSHLRALEGRLVEVRGWLVPMNGGWWMMNLGHTSMLREP